MARPANPLPRNRWAWTVSIILHCLLFSLLSNLWLDSENEGRPGSTEITLVSQPGTSKQTEPIEIPPPKSSPIPSDQKVAELITKSVTSGQGMDPAEQLSKLDRHLRKLERVSSPESVGEIGELVRRSVGTKSRAYAPVTPPPPGEFDSHTGLIYSARQGTNDKGKPCIFYLMVDAVGRTLEVEAPADSRSEAAMAALRMQQSPLLRQLFEQVVLPVLDSQSPPVDGAQ